MSRNRRVIVADAAFVGDAWEIEVFLGWLREDRSSRDAKRATHEFLSAAKRRIPLESERDAAKAKCAT
jgi:hypothetical protein